MYLPPLCIHIIATTRFTNESAKSLIQLARVSKNLALLSLGVELGRPATNRTPAQAVKRLIANAYGPHHPTITGAEIRRWTDPFRAEGARRAIEGMAKHGIAGLTRPELRRLRVPALVVWGASDNVDPVAVGRQSARDLRAPFVLVHGAGHLSMLAAAHAVAAAIAPR